MVATVLVCMYVWKIKYLIMLGNEATRKSMWEMAASKRQSRTVPHVDIESSSVRAGDCVCLQRWGHSQRLLQYWCVCMGIIS